MLSKSQARLFFIGGTVLFSLLFLFLTVDTILKVPAQTNQQNLTDAVKRGKRIWDENNCMGCHTLLGEGAYYAPELTKVYTRRGVMWLKLFLKDPQAMFPGERKMVNYHFKEKQIDDLIAFFKWIGEMDLNGFPPKPGLKSEIPGVKAKVQARVPAKMAPRPVARKVAARTQPTSRPTQRIQAPPVRKIKPIPEPAKFALCRACHMLGGSGGKVGPALDGIGKKFNPTYLAKWLTDPQSVKPGTKMPKLPFSKTELDEMVRYLSSQR